MVALIDKIKNTLKIFEPMTFPNAISEFFLKAATVEVANSGNEVPNATMVKPITDWLTPTKVQYSSPKEQ